MLMLAPLDGSKHEGGVAPLVLHVDVSTILHRMLKIVMDVITKL